MNSERVLFVLEHGLHKELARAKKAESLARKNGDTESKPVLEFLEKYGQDTFKETNSLLRRRAEKLARIRKRIKPFVSSGRAIFLTLTFNDETLSKTSPEWRRKLVGKFLSSQCVDYFANIDFGDENEREHYHALVVPCGLKIDYSPWNSKYGAIKGKRVPNNGKDLNRISKYVTKLTYHAAKKSTGNLRNMLCPKKVVKPKDVEAFAEPAPDWLDMTEEELNDYFCD